MTKSILGSIEGGSRSSWEIQIAEFCNELTPAKPIYDANAYTQIRIDEVVDIFHQGVRAREDLD